MSFPTSRPAVHYVSAVSSLIQRASLSLAESGLIFVFHRSFQKDCPSGAKSSLLNISRGILSRYRSRIFGNLVAHPLAKKPLAPARDVVFVNLAFFFFFKRFKGAYGDTGTPYSLVCLSVACRRSGMFHTWKVCGHPAQEGARPSAPFSQQHLAGRYMSLSRLGNSCNSDF